MLSFIQFSRSIVKTASRYRHEVFELSKVLKRSVDALDQRFESVSGGYTETTLDKSLQKGRV